MPVRSAKSGRPVADVAIRPMLSVETAAILRQILNASDFGVLLTDLDHRSLACNRKFGELFEVDPERAVRCDVEELRRMVRPLISNLRQWESNLDDLYASPESVFEDTISLNKKPPITVRRYSGPVKNDSGETIGRIWTFRDVTAEQRLQWMVEMLHEASTFFDPDPAVVYRKVMGVVSAYYDHSTCILSVRSEDYMAFRAVVGPMSTLRLMKGNALKDAY
jgi:transcriptional regulator with PAS, ATPase and Fis domain